MTDGVSLSALKPWIGRSVRHHDVVGAARARGLFALFDEQPPALETGAIIPPEWHWIYFWNADRQSDLGPDGHKRRGEFMPPVPLPRRLFAGADLRCHDALRIGDRIILESTISNIRLTSGSAGPLVFVTVNRVIRRGETVLLDEDQSIAYLGPPAPAAGRVSSRDPVDEADWQGVIHPDPAMLFRFSALTFNAHRIHYDRRYAMEVEGHQGLVVHGPLIALVMLRACRRAQPTRSLARFTFRARLPAIDTDLVTVAGRRRSETHSQLWALNQNDDLLMTGEVEWNRELML